MDSNPGTSKENVQQESSSNAQKEDESDTALIPFVCHICGLNVKCRYGKVEAPGRTHSYEYDEELYYLMDPFRNRAKPDERRLGPDQKFGGGDSKRNAPNIFEYFIIGSLCSICGQAVCLDELCSIYYSKTFCSTCVTREKAHFPAEIIQQLEAARAARKRRKAEEVKPPAVEEVEKDP